MPVSQSQISVGTTATPLVASSSARRRFVIGNDSGGDVWIGNASVTSTTGIKIPTATKFEVIQQFPTDPSAKFAWYGVTTTSAKNVQVVEVAG